MRKRRSKTNTNAGWTDIPKTKKHYERTFKYTKEKTCINCTKAVGSKQRFCDNNCKEAYYERVERYETETFK